MITKIDFPSLRNSELVQFLNDSVTICASQDVEQLKLTVPVNNLKTHVNLLNDSYKIAKGSDITEEMVSFDIQRDDCIVGIRMCVDGFTRHFDSIIRDAAYSILGSFNKYGKTIQYQNYETETRNIESLTSDWTNDAKLTAAITKLNLNGWAAELTRTNGLFNKKYLSRVDEKATKPAVKFAQTRRNTIESFKMLVSMIEANFLLTGDTAYNALINPLNVLIDKYNQIGASHSTKKGSDTQQTSSASSKN
jgi:hypothetical protein